MKLTDAQIRGRVKNLAAKTGTDARILMRLHMMERFLERVSVSKYRDNFVIKGGVLITSLIGVSLRSTMDIDTTIQNHDLSDESAREMIEEISLIDIGDGVTFEKIKSSKIMDDMEYPGIRFSMNACIGRMVTPIKIDVSTGASITPCAVEHEYKLMLEDRAITLLSYNLETILAEKLQTIFSRGVVNTCMRDFYDIYVLTTAYRDKTDPEVLAQAFEATCKDRHTEDLAANSIQIYEKISSNKRLHELWNNYQKKYDYAAEIEFDYTLMALSELFIYACRLKFNAETEAAIQESIDIANGKIEAKKYSSFEEFLADLDL
jgi:predicted nucleotidyltransferase component of viral defense system